MKLSVTDWGNFDQVLPVALKHKVGLEIQEFTRPENLDDPDELALKILEKSRDLPILSMHGPFSDLIPASRDILIRQVTRKRFGQACEVAGRFGAQHLIFHSGFIPKTYPAEMWLQNTYSFWKEFLMDVPVLATLHLENVYEDNYHNLRELVDRINQAFSREYLTICLDLGHVNANSSLPVEDWIKELGNRIHYVHVHNNGGILDDHWRLNKGTLDIARTLDLLQQYSPNALWTIETPENDIESSLIWLQEKGYM